VYCSKCGSVIADGSTFCGQCGQSSGLVPTSAATAPVVAAGLPPIVPPVVAVGPTIAPAMTVAYAGFWLRVLAYLIDAIILGIFAVPIVICAAMAMGLGGIFARIPRDGDNPFANGPPPIFLLFIWFCVLLGVGGTWLYNALLESSEWQGSAGKKALGLIVTDMEGRRVTFARASGRHFGKIVTSFIPLGIGYTLAGFTQKRQALHDMLASCLVLRKD
jgi:uncharacterized RDD family membrane protein YckC